MVDGYVTSKMEHEKDFTEGNGSVLREALFREPTVD